MQETLSINEEFVERVYLSAIGMIRNNCAIPGVNNLFAPGEKCDQLYAQVRDAYERVCKRLGGCDGESHDEIAEDSDLNDILNLMDRICQEVAFEMFRCGALFSPQDK